MKGNQSRKKKAGYIVDSDFKPGIGDYLRSFKKLSPIVAKISLFFLILGNLNLKLPINIKHHLINLKGQSWLAKCSDM